MKFGIMHLPLIFQNFLFSCCKRDNSPAAESTVWDFFGWRRGLKKMFFPKEDRNVKSKYRELTPKAHTQEGGKRNVASEAGMRAHRAHPVKHLDIQRA
jgi:hypothetical protein